MLDIGTFQLTKVLEGVYPVQECSSSRETEDYESRTLDKGTQILNYRGKVIMRVVAYTAVGVGRSVHCPVIHNFQYLPHWTFNREL